MIRDPIVGIDLGTSNSCVAFVGPDGIPRVLPGADGRPIVPSVVSFHPNGSVLVGDEAKRRRIIDPANTVYSVKRIIGRRSNAAEVAACAARSSFVIKEGPNETPMVGTRAGEFSVPEIGAIILDHLRKIAESTLGTEVRRAVVTVPANFNDAQRQATAAAGEIAELIVVRILNEPTAAALAYGHGRALRQTVAVYDFGGGTFDITILALRDDVYEVLATAGDTFLGGDDIDQRLTDFMVNAFLQQHRVDLRYDILAMQRVRQAAEDAKCALSTDSKTVVEVDSIAVGAGGANLDMRFTITRDAFVPRIADIIDRSFPVCDEALRLAGLAATQIDEVVLVGGTTRIPYVRQRVAQYFGRDPRADVNPDEAVALGAALQGASLAAVLDGARGAGPSQRTMMMPSDMQMLEPPPLPPPGPAPLGRMPLKQVAQPGPRIDSVVEKNPFAEITDVDVDADRINTPTALIPTLVQQAPVRAPVLLDVTPRALAVATVGGYCDEVIPRNVQIPIEQSRVFTTAHDEQTAVEVKICQGESRRFDENILLGSIVLDRLPALPRGKLKISVTFEINTDGILEARARDDQTGQVHSVRVKLLGAQSDEQIAAARDRIKSLRT